MFRSIWLGPFRAVFRTERRSASLDIGLVDGLSLSGWVGWWSPDLWALDAHVNVDLQEDNSVGIGGQALPLRFGASIKRIIPRTWTKAWYARADADREAHRSRYWAHDLVNRRETGVRINDTIRVDIWKSDSAWSRDSRKDWPWKTYGWDFSFGWVDALIGATNYEQEPGTWHDATLTMDGREIPMRVHLYRCRWRRSRWYSRALAHAWGRWVHRACISVAGHDHHDPDREQWSDIKPPRFAGKGENAWDCGDDATYAMTVPVRSAPYTVADLVDAYRADVEQSRQKYGMPSEAA